MFKVVKMSIKKQDGSNGFSLLGFIFVVWDLLAVRPIFLPAKLHQNKHLKHRWRVEKF